MVRAGNLESALMIHINKSVVAELALAASTQAQIIGVHAVDSESAFVNFHLLSVALRYAKSQNARESHAVQVTVIPEYLPSTEPAGSSAIEVFSDKVMLHVIVPHASGSPQSPESVGAAIIACLWSRRAATVAAPADAESANACVDGTVASNASIVASVLTNVAATPAEFAVPSVSAGVPPTGTEGEAGIACLWSRRAATVAEPAAAESPNACVEGTVASKARMVAFVLTNVVALPAALAVPRVSAGVHAAGMSDVYAIVPVAAGSVAT
jgi:hypothetical protein